MFYYQPISQKYRTMFIYCCTFTIKSVNNSPFFVFICRLKYPIGHFYAFSNHHLEKMTSYMDHK